MADLGGIQFVNPNTGIQPGEDRRAELQHLAAGLGTGKAIAEGVILKNIQDNMYDSLDKSLSTSLENVATTTDPGMDALPKNEPYSPSAREAYLVKRLDRLNTVMEQGSVSQRTLAEMEIQNIMVQATSRFPWLRDEIQRRAGATLNGAWQMSKIGVHDTVRREAADAASAQYKALLDDAYGRVENGGLGIPRDLHPDDPEFIRLYSKHSQDRFFQQQYELKRQVLAAQDGTSFMEAVPEMDRFLTVAGGGASTYWRNFMASTGLERSLVLDRNGQLPPLEAENLRRAVPGYMAQIDMLKADMQSAWQNAYMKPRFLSNPEAKARQEQFDGLMKMYDNMKNTLKEVGEGTQGAEQRLKIQMDIMNHDMFNDLDPSAQKRLSFVNGPGNAILPLVEKTLGASPLFAVSMFGGLLTDDLQKMVLGGAEGDIGALAVQSFNSTGTVEIPPNAKAVDIIQAVRARHLDDYATWVYPTKGKEAAIASFANIKVHEALWDAAEGVLDAGSAQYADQAVLGTIYSLEFWNSSKVRPSNLLPEYLKVVGSAKMHTALERATPEMRKAFGQSLEQFYNSQNPESVRQTTGSKMVNTYPLSGPETMYSLVKVSAEKLAQNEFYWYPDPVAKKNLVTALMAIGEDERNANDKVDKFIGEEMAKITEVMNQQIGAQVSIQLAKGEPMTWSELFLGGNGTNRTATWASLFQIDSSRMGL